MSTNREEIPVKDYVMPDAVLVELAAWRALVGAGLRRMEAADELDPERAKALVAEACRLERSAGRMVETLGSVPGWWGKLSG